MTYFRGRGMREFEFTAFSGEDILGAGDDFLSRGDSFTMPVSATATFTVTDNDQSLSGDARRNERGDDKRGQTATIETAEGTTATDAKIYAEEYYTLRDEDGNCYFLIEIETAGAGGTDRADNFTFFGKVPPAGATLTVIGGGNVHGNWLSYDKLSAGLNWTPDADGKIVIEAEDMNLSGYKTDDIDAASGGEVIKLRKHEGEATLTFGPESGVYDVAVAYVDENDGQGEIEVLVNGAVVQTIAMTADSDGNGGDSSSVSSLTIDNLALAQGDTITLRGSRDGGEFARIDALTFCADNPPVAEDLAASGDEDAAITGQLLASDADGDALTFTLETDAANGSVTVNADGSFSYQPDENFNGEDSFTYLVADGNGGTSSATVSLTVAPVNDAPVAGDDTGSMAENDVAVFDVLGNDSDVDGDDLSVSLVSVGKIDGVGKIKGPVDGSLVTIDDQGRIVIDSNGGFDALAVGESGTKVITYQVDDGQGGTATASLTVTVTGVNDAPVAEAGAASGDEDTALTGQLVASDVDGDALTFALATDAANGTVTVNPDGSFSYQPAADFNGEDSFIYTASDGNGGTATETVALTVAPVNDAPVAEAGAASGDEDTALTGQLVASDVDGDALTFSLATDAANGTVTVNPDGSFSYQPVADFNGEDSFTYTVSDGNGGTATETVALTVAPVNDAPVAADIAGEVLETAATGPDANETTIAAAFTDVDLTDSFSFEVDDSSTAGQVINNGDGTFTYSAADAFDLAAGQIATDSFEYTVTDASGASDTALATVTIVGEGDATASESFTGNTPNTGQEVTISLTTDSTTEDGAIDVGIDINFGAVLQPQINVVYVVDTSGSTIASVLAEEQAALVALTEQISELGFADGSVSISIVPFSTTSGPDATGDDSSTFVLDQCNDAGTTDVADVTAAINSLTGGGFTNYIEALGETQSILTGLDPNNEETNVVFFLSDGQPTVRDTTTGQITTQTEAQIAAAAAPVQAIAQISAFEIGNVNALQFLDALDNTGGAQSVNDPSDLSAALLGSPIPEGTVVEADLFIFDDSEVFGTLVDTIGIDVPGDIDDPANPDLVETPLGLELDFTATGLANDLGDANRVALVVQFDDNGDGIVDLPLFVEVDVFGSA